MRIARLLSALTLGWGLLLLPLSLCAQTAEKINLFDAHIVVNKDSSIQVTEGIFYDFGSNERHGIYRDIPKEFTDEAGVKHPLQFSAISVTDEGGQPYQTKLSDEGSFYRIKIGDPNKTITGVHVYAIRYTVQGAIVFAPTFDELYWNVTGNGWEVPIEKSAAQIAMPEVAAISGYACYQGPQGSKNACDTKTYISPTEGGDNTVQFGSVQQLPAGSGLTIGVGIVKNLITQTAQPDKPSMEGVTRVNVLGIAFGFLIPLITLIICSLIWYRIGRDPHESTIVAEYDAPADMSVLEMSAMVHPYNQGKDTSAAILSLAAQGAFIITQVETTSLLVFHKKGYRLSETGGRAVLKNDLDQRLFDALFEGASIEEGDTKKSILVSKINKTGMVKALASLKSDVAKRLVEKGYYTRNPNKVRGLFLSAALLIGGLALYVLGSLLSAPVLVGMVVAAIIIALFAIIIPQKTEKGAQLHRQLLGLKLYMSVAEKDRINFHNAPEKSPQLFEKLLPYAMLFGVVSIWVKEFEGIAQSPTYYHGASGTWIPTAFASDMNSFASSISAVSIASSGAGGGGFSGGGGGGGGGGSW